MISPAPPILSNNGAGSKSVTILGAEAPYRLPANLDFDKLHSMVLASLTAIEDHITTMREDPGYYAETISNVVDHRREWLPFPDELFDSILEPSNIHELFHRSEGIAIAEPYL